MIKRLCFTGYLLAAPALHGQGPTRCFFDNTPATREFLTKLPSGQFNTFFGAGVIVRCPAKKLVLKSDSLESYGDEKRVFLIGHVDYAEPRFTLTSDYLTYLLSDERIVATGNVHGHLPNGSTAEGPMMTYFRAAPKIRPRAQLLATARPTVRIVAMDSLGRSDNPIAVTANTIFMDGDSLLYGSGVVEIQRTELTARGDSVFLDGTRETMRLMRGPSVEGKHGDRPFKLIGEVIDVYSAKRKVRRVVAQAKAVATSGDLVLHADTIDLRVNADLLDRAIAWGAATRARATSPAQNILADSIDVRMPAQRVHEMRAYRQAIAEAKADTVKFRADSTDVNDWLRGDTIIARFDTIAKPDSAGGPQIRQLRAMGNAKSLYHLAPQDTTLRRPAISYAVGRDITIDFDSRRVATVDVSYQARGVLLEPVADSTKRSAPRSAPSASRVRGRPGARIPGVTRPLS